MVSKVREFAAQAYLCAVGNSKGYIFKHDLLAQAGVKPGDAFRILVADHKIIFEYPVPPMTHTVIPRPLSFYLKRRRNAGKRPAANEMWPDDAPRGKERLR